MSQPALLIRADAGVAIGTGHVMRCLALAQAWQDAGGRVVFATSHPPAPVRARMLKESVDVCEISSAATLDEDAKKTVALAQTCSATWIAVDGYRFGSDYQRALKAGGLNVLFLDDYGHAMHYYADYVLNQNLSANESLYVKREPYTRLLLGPQYCLLRRDFVAWRQWARNVAPIGRRVLVTMGGSDPNNFTEKTIAALDAIADQNVEAVVVVGAGNLNSEFLAHAAATNRKKIEVRRDVSNMAEIMAWADVAVSAAGTTCWEICLLGLPSLLIDVAENQTPLARELHRCGCAKHLGGVQDVSSLLLAQQLEGLLASQVDRQAMSQRSRQLVDGEGAARVVSALLEHET